MILKNYKLKGKYIEKIKKIYEEKGESLTTEEYENIENDLINFASLLVKDYLDKKI
jgi:hypothetical protein